MNIDNIVTEQRFQCCMSIILAQFSRFARDPACLWTG
ncbi:hypothetical protein EM595_0988 [Duffyella gerundensis]|uniref:Uncharacterized protein n=1 Tax=Duffyella gerundensis TaxID=1619313 RepID=A0A0U5L1E5_9GAMM|nr:hypothetical protein EM595_0988 [Duffyella gerundensis]